MTKVKYHFNINTLKYERVRVKLWDRLKGALWILLVSGAFATVTIFFAYQFLDSPKEKQLKREIEALTYNYEILNNRLEKVNKVLGNLQERDDNIYRVVFEAEPIPNTVRKAGFGGVERYKELMGLGNSDLIVESAMKMDKLSKQLYIQSKSYDEISTMISNKSQLLAAIPAVQPVSNKNLKAMASGFGWRTHPIYKIQKFHSGMDFSAPIGTPIYSTGNGIVTAANDGERGYGNRVEINHGYGYSTLYAHMSRFAVKQGQKVQRGDLIGYVGNTGASTGPHLHYEVIKNNEKVNPVNYFYNDLSPAEYATMMDLSSKASQSFD
jgi:murein DD-endopeptidase MepM/ murein hydrolase activator NlpD